MSESLLNKAAGLTPIFKNIFSDSFCLKNFIKQLRWSSHEKSFIIDVLQSPKHL